MGDDVSLNWGDATLATPACFIFRSFTETHRQDKKAKWSMHEFTATLGFPIINILLSAAWFATLRHVSFPVYFAQ